MIEISRAEECHLPSIGRLWWEFILYNQAIDSHFTVREGSIPHFLENHVSRFMGSDDGLVLIAVENGTVVGYSLSEVQGPIPISLKQDRWGYIDQLAVTESHRRKGIGEKMLGVTIAWFKSKDVSRIGAAGFRCKIPLQSNQRHSSRHIAPYRKARRSSAGERDRRKRRTTWQLVRPIHMTMSL